MDALVESFLALFDPITSSQLLAGVGLAALCIVAPLLLAGATAEASGGLGHIITGLGHVVAGLAMLAAAVIFALLAIGLAHGTLAHIRH
ncbi:MAG: hypothetical protein H5T64_13425 [Chloroflexi bacterium]|nr:hypothetical protein [Chloroflexota bacterium]